MTRSRLFVFACVIAVSASSLVAQPEPEAVLQLELTRGETIVAKPQLRLTPGREGSLDLNGEWAASHPLVKGLREKITITPEVRGDEIALALNIASADKQFRPAMVISKDVRGAVEWTAADGQPVRLTVSWIQ